MIDLKDFYLQNTQKEEYHYRFYSLIENINMTFNIFNDTDDSEDSDDRENLVAKCYAIDYNKAKDIFIGGFYHDTFNAFKIIGAIKNCFPVSL